MRLLPKQVWNEEFDYYSDKSVEVLKAEIQQLFEKANGWNFSVNLAGEFVSEYEFKMTPKWQFAIIRSFEREVSYLKGKIFADEFKRTRVKFSVRPNSIFAIFLFLFPAFGIFALSADNVHGNERETKIVGLVFVFVVPALILFFGQIAKENLKNRFVKTFNLRAIN